YYYVADGYVLNFSGAGYWILDKTFSKAKFAHYSPPFQGGDRFTKRPASKSGAVGLLSCDATRSVKPASSIQYQN
ncbi:MAG: hypothetical protein KDI38_21620, partial [Calditrichaeota bacterium]|nr:hypothetical protein [Calditrichota bacterium]